MHRGFGILFVLTYILPGGLYSVDVRRLLLVDYMLELDMWAKSKSVLVPFFGSMPENNA
jgi:hypothetical protein